MLRYNKGEWCEIYVLLKLLCDGKLFLSDYKKYYTIVSANLLKNESNQPFLSLMNVYGLARQKWLLHGF